MNACTTLKEAETTSTEVEQTVLTPRADKGAVCLVPSVTPSCVAPSPASVNSATKKGNFYLAN